MSERRRFTHLSQVEIRDIVSSFYNGEPKLSIANRLNIDHSTVHYHVRKYERAYPENPNVYSLVKVSFRKVCAHPSMKCSLCGKYEDELRNEERATIRELTDKLIRANQRLERAGLYVE